MTRLRVFLVNCGIRTFTNFWVVPPMGILSLAAYLREKRPVDLLLANQRFDKCGPTELAQRAEAFEADVFGLSALTLHAGSLNAIIRAVRAARPNVFVIIGGAHASGVGPSVLESIEADAAVMGEGEIAFEQAIQARFDDDDMSRAPGLVWRAPDGTVVANPGTAPIIEDLDSLPMPAYDLIDLPAYWRHQSIAPVFRRKYVSLVTSRGCPYRCFYCHSIFGKRIRMCSPERVLEDVTWLRRKYQVDDVEFLDDTFNYDGGRLIRICEQLQTQHSGLKFAIPNGVRGDILTQEHVDALADAGLFNCVISLETGSPRIQKLIGKNLNIPRFLKASEMLTRRHVHVHTGCMFGFPTETEEEMQTTIDVACEAQTHTTSFFTLTPFPGTPLYDLAKEKYPEKLAALSYDDVTLNSVKVNLTDLPDEVLYAYIRKAVRRYSLDPKRIARIIRDNRQPWYLPLYAPMLAYRLLRG